MNDKFGFKAAKAGQDPKTATDAEADDLSDFQPAEPHSPDPETEARADRRAAEVGFPPRDPASQPPEDSAPPPEQVLQRRRPPKEPATQLTLHIPVRVANRFVAYCDTNNFRSYWSALEDLMDKADVPG